MVSQFYRQHSHTLIAACMLLMPCLMWYGERLPANNNIETWLPQDSDVREAYNHFCRTFGADETVLIAFDRPFPETDRLNALAGRIRGLEGIAECRTRADIIALMMQNDVSQQTAEQRLVHLVSAPDGNLETMLVVLDRNATSSRFRIVEQIREQLAYCDLESAHLAGPPIVATRLDMLGSRKSGKNLFLITLLICGGLLYLNLGCWKTSVALVVANVFSIEATLTIMNLAGQEMNFILSSLPVMVMVFTTASSVHFIGHFRHTCGHPLSMSRAMKSVMWPSVFAAATTVIGLMSLTLSEMGPIPDFGRAASIGTLVSFVVGIGVTPAVLTVLKYHPPALSTAQMWLERCAMSVLTRPARYLIPTLSLTAFCSIGVMQLKSLIDPLEFLPSNDRVLRDTRVVQDRLTSPTSIEAIVDFAGTNMSFVDRLKYVRRLEESMAQNDNVCHTFSLADFFPSDLDQRDLNVSQLISSAGSQSSGSLIADGIRLWRISVRMKADSPSDVRATTDALTSLVDSDRVTLTGIGPLLEEAQTGIFDGFWKSLGSAFVLITIVMIIALRSLKAGAVAMIPNMTPILLVFGLLGWARFPIDIGIMMTASIALGLAVDGTFHLLFSYQSALRSTHCRYRSIRRALMKTGMPIISSAIISGTGLLALSLSQFRPTMRFGIMMFCLLVTALVGDLIVLPAMLAIGTRRLRRRVDPATRTKQQQSIAA
jgi:predicted RND superfamily exporter protein